jgi:hypothetical protein
LALSAARLAPTAKDTHMHLVGCYKRLCADCGSYFVKNAQSKMQLCPTYSWAEKNPRCRPAASFGFFGPAVSLQEEAVLLHRYHFNDRVRVRSTCDNVSLRNKHGTVLSTTDAPSRIKSILDPTCSEVLWDTRNKSFDKSSFRRPSAKFY